MPRPLFNSLEQAISVTFHMTQRLTFVVAWMGFVIAHLLLLCLLLVLLWAFQVTPAALAEAAASLASTRPVAFLTAVGVSVAGVIAGYWRFAVKVQRWAVSGPLLRYLTQDVRSD